MLSGIQGGVQLLRMTGSTEHLESSLEMGLAYLRCG
jgi:hypothetical protein